MNIQEARTLIAGRLKEAGIESPDYETWAFLEWKAGISRADYYMDPGREIPEGIMNELLEVLARREKHYPLQYLMGSCEFMGYDFSVDERVLIPRQDTECLVERAIQFVREKEHLIHGEDQKIRVLDLCTGSGCIGISLKLFCPKAELVLSDLSSGAIEVAIKNASDLGVSVDILQGDLFDALNNLPEEKRYFDLIVSNPPYIPTKVVEGLMPEVRDHEPHMALDGTGDGLLFYRRITAEAWRYLKPGGGLFYEIGAEQGNDVAELMKKEHFTDVCIHQDLAGLDRIVSGRINR